MAYRQISAAEWVTAGNKNGSFGSRFKFDGTGGRSRAGAGIDGDLVVGLHGFREGIGFALLPTSHHVAIGVQRSDDAGVAQPSGYHPDVLVLLQGHACMEVLQTVECDAWHAYSFPQPFEVTNDRGHPHQTAIAVGKHELPLIVVEELLEPEPAKYLYCSVVQVNLRTPLVVFGRFVIIPWRWVLTAASTTLT